MKITKLTKEEKHVCYTIEEEGLTFMDVLIFSPEEFEKMDEKQMDSIAIEKYEKWKEYVMTPKKKSSEDEVEKEVTRLQNEKTFIEQQISILNKQ